ALARRASGDASRRPPADQARRGRQFLARAPRHQRDVLVPLHGLHTRAAYRRLYLPRPLRRRSRTVDWRRERVLVVRPVAEADRDVGPGRAAGGLAPDHRRLFPGLWADAA